MEESLESLKSLNSLESPENGRILLCCPQSGSSLESLESLNSAVLRLEGLLPHSLSSNGYGRGGDKPPSACVLRDTLVAY